MLDPDLCKELEGKTIDHVDSCSSGEKAIFYFTDGTKAELKINLVPFGFDEITQIELKVA